MAIFSDLSEKRFGRLVVDSFSHRDAKGKVHWLCACDCGGAKVTRAENLRSGSTRSCGCLGIEQRKQAARGRVKVATRGKYPSEWNSWNAMVSRCHNPSDVSFCRYGAKGVKVCDSWRYSFQAFLSDMGLRPEGATLDRKNNNRGYSPGNCRWATRKEQANNRSTCHLLTHDGKTMNIEQWASHLGWSRGVIASRIKYGWPTERVLSEPPRKVLRQER